MSNAERELCNAFKLALIKCTCFNFYLKGLFYKEHLTERFNQSITNIFFLSQAYCRDFSKQNVSIIYHKSNFSLQLSLLCAAFIFIATFCVHTSLQQWWIQEFRNLGARFQCGRILATDCFDTPSYIPIVLVVRAESK